ncbi:MAG: YlxR family protein [Clostridia bacterium]|nr:YlxR family protein [Clostridia bacterium]
MKERKIPERSCVGCGEKKAQKELLRIAYYEGQITIDHSGRAKGRGVYLCKSNPKCVELAVKKKAFYRNFKDVKEEQISKLLEELKEDEQ